MTDNNKQSQIEAAKRHTAEIDKFLNTEPTTLEALESAAEHTEALQKSLIAIAHIVRADTTAKEMV